MSSDSAREMLIYNKDKSIMTQLLVTEEVILEMKDRLKAYFDAHMEESKTAPGTYNIMLDNMIENQKW